VRFSTVYEWLHWISSVHFCEMELGLERVREVGIRLNVVFPNHPVIVVGGTNGKGSTVTSLERIYLSAGYQVGAFTSPMLFKHNEQIRVNGREVSDQDFCDAFEKIDIARGEISLTSFEFFTLAALLIFHQHDLDVMILEVGLGGRLDAVNIIHADVSIITSIGIDHEEWLGSTRESIAYEKSGILRTQTPAICGDANPPVTLIEYANILKTPIFCQGREFTFKEYATYWSWFSPVIQYDYLPKNGLSLQNLSTSLMAITVLQDKLAVTQLHIEKGLLETTLPGRIQVIEGIIPEIYDVSHNPAAVSLLAEYLAKTPHDGKTHAVFSMLADKNIEGCIQIINDYIDAWYIAPLFTKRAATQESLLTAFSAKQNKPKVFPSVKAAYSFSKEIAQPGDRIIVFGSFHTVAEVLCMTQLPSVRR